MINSQNTLTLLFTIAIDYVQENVMGQGKQNNESAVEQAKDEQISVRCSIYTCPDLQLTTLKDYIRGKYESTSGSDMPIKDKDTTFSKD